ncbi:hypothetical protein ACO0SA_000056 [Hanseniaspora valbyensis]|uniref:Stress-associated endoplasmic reticulum protein n=1 Tax=Hanseniaspora valbyensis NRRL Y-1626 TaxID=766949 RepID=A0A1B7TH57_9ASCO|nr:hypothetical protein HANVADRAFT_51776 [Hanseniaspora valbyensis NRRL Y-1626]
MAGVNKQTNPKIRRANAKFANDVKQNRKYGKPKVTKSKSDDKPALSKYWIFVLAFLIIGGGILELISLFF